MSINNGQPQRYSRFIKDILKSGRSFGIIDKKLTAKQKGDRTKTLDSLYRLVLGRPLESRSIADAAVNVPVDALLASLVSSEEFRVRVAQPLLNGESPDAAWLAGSSAVGLAPDVMRAAGAVDIGFLNEDEPLRRLTGLLRVPSAYRGLRQGLGEAGATELLEKLNKGQYPQSHAQRAEAPAGAAAQGRLVEVCDLENAYRLVLAREPEAAVLEGDARLGIPLAALFVGLFESAEFSVNYLAPCLRGQAAAAGYFETLSAPLCDWVVDLDLPGLDRLRVEAVDSLGELVDLLLRNKTLTHACTSEQIALYVKTHSAQSNPWRLRTRPELIKLNLTDYPQGFNWHAYLQHNPGAGATRWQALRHFLDRIDPTDHPIPTFEEGRAEFLAAVGVALAPKLPRHAAILLQQAALIRPLSSAELESAGDAMAGLHLDTHALAYYRELAVQDEASLTVLIKAADAAISVVKLDEAIFFLRKTLAMYGAQPKYRALLLPYFETKLRASADSAFAHYRQNDRAAADATLIEFVKDAANELLELYPLGLPLARDNLKRVLLFADTSLPQCKHYRVDQKLSELKVLGFHPELFELADHELLFERLPGAEALIVYRHPAWPTVIRAILTARSLGVPVFFEIDDLLFDSSQYPDTFESYGNQIRWNEYIGLQFGVPLFKAAAELCDYAIASTEPLAVEMRKLVRSGQAWVVPNSLDERIESVAAAAARRSSRDVTIFYGTGTRAHNSDFDDQVAPALIAVLKNNPQARLLIVGYLVLPPAFDVFLSQIIKIDFVKPVEAYWRLLAEADINVAVLNPSVMADCKSEIKWLEAAAFSIPSIVSPTAAHRQALTDGHDVLFAETPDDWAKAFARLIDDPDLRRRLGDNAKATAQAKFSHQAAAGALSSAIDYARSERPPFAAKPRLMLANVYFPPQTIGGATRVLKDNIDAFLDLGLCDEFDLAILTTDAGVRPDGRLSVDSYRGLPVFRISTPEEVNMDWRPSNPAIAAIFSRICDLWKPDLVHFHCVQRLTGSVVDICRRNYTPYLVTAHDAWWLSDYQFLTNDKNQVIDPSTTAPRATPPAGITEAQSRSRSVYLRALLDGAQAVLAVSKSFSAVYRSAGVENVRTVANGLPRLTVCDRRPSPDGRVRLAHVGNVTTHKGFHLVRQALLEGHFANLHLTAVDHSLRPGDLRTETWGQTQVDIVGPCSQDAMPAFYARHDVLLAPSIWPESFGLVTREALAAGLWVVASDRGAIGEDVAPGVNGFVIDVASHLALQSVLDRIDSDPAGYLVSPPPTPLRSSDDQARELIDIYRQVVSERARAAPSAAIH